MEQTKMINRILYPIYFSVSVLFMEVVFHLVAVGSFSLMEFSFVALFSLAYGAIGFLLSSIFKKPLVNQIISSVLLGLTALPYVVQFLIVKQFKQFYDINTMANGTGALTSYFREILELLFPKGGILIVLLLFLPLIAWLIFGKKLTGFARSTLWVRIVTVLASVLCYILSIFLIHSSVIYRPMYGEQYNFQSAVSSFGLISGLRLDVQSHIFVKEVEFSGGELPVITLPTEENTDPTDPDATTEPTEPPVVYGDNVMDIDFEELNKSASSTFKKLNNYVSSLTPSKKNQYTGLFEGKNLIFISAEAFSAELIDPELTPTLYRLANQGIQFTDFYQPASAGTTGGEYQNLFGMLPTAGGKSMQYIINNYNCFTLGSQLDRLGYYGKAYHNNSYTYYNRDQTHFALGYSDGFMGYGNGMEEYVTEAWPQSDYEMFAGTVPTYIDKEHFNIYYMTVSGHNNYSVGSNSQTKKHWDKVQHLPYSSKIKGYYAANLDLEAALTYLVEQLEAKGIADDTVICLVADHFPYGLDNDAGLGKMPYLDELYGYHVTDYFQRDHNRAIIWSGCLEDMDPIVVDTPTFSLDILPTLSNLFGLEFDSRLMVGRDVLSDASALVFNYNYDWKTELGTYYASKNKFVPAVEGMVVPESYITAVKAIVRDKINFCNSVLNQDYYRYLFDKD